MSEYIISNEQLGLIRDFATVCVEGEKLPRIVRCRNCRHFKKGEEEQPIDWCCYFHDEVTPLGFCAWGTKTEFVTCKCGEDIERIGRIQTCPSCGRKVMA